MRGRRVPAEISASAWAIIDDTDIEADFRKQINVIMKFPSFLRGRLRHAYSLAL